MIALLLAFALAQHADPEEHPTAEESIDAAQITVDDMAEKLDRIEALLSEDDAAEEPAPATGPVDTGAPLPIDESCSIEEAGPVEDTDEPEGAKG